MAKCNLGKVKLQANAVSDLLRKCTWSLGWPQGPFVYLVTYVASHAGINFLSWSLWISCLSKSLQILAPSPSLLFCALVSMGFRWVFSTEVFQCDCASWQLHAGVVPGWLPWIPSCYAWGAQAPIQLLRHQFPSSSIGNEFNFRQNICNSFLPVILLLSILLGCAL